MMRRPTLVWTTLLSLGILFAGEVQAASLEISPVLVNLAPGQTAATIEVQNRGGAPTAVQARAYSWTQVGDDDVLTPTQEIILSPPIFTISEGASQTVRILLRGGRGAGAERSYRLLLDEVPSANNRNRQVVTTLHLSLPVVAASPSSGPPALRWRVERSQGGETLLTAVNTGHAYDKVIALDVNMSDGSHPKIGSRGKNPYVLPGATRHWVVQGGGRLPVGPIRLSVTTQAGKSEQTLTP